MAIKAYTCVADVVDDMPTGSMEWYHAMGVAYAEYADRPNYCRGNVLDWLLEAVGPLSVVQLLAVAAAALDFGHFPECALSSNNRFLAINEGAAG